MKWSLVHQGLFYSPPQSNLIILQHTSVVVVCLSGAVFELGLAPLISKPKEILRIAILSTLDLVFQQTCQTTLTDKQQTTQISILHKEIKNNHFTKVAFNLPH